MTRQRYRNNRMQATIKDYLVPIIGGVIILIILYSIFSGGSDTPIVSDENRSPTQISFADIDTQAFIVYPGDIREEINESYNLYKGERIIVKNGSVLLKAPTGNSINLNKVAELKYEEDGSYSLYSSDAWLTLQNDTEISMSYANISAPAGSIIALTQNEANSTVYVLSGSAKVTNLGGISTLIIKGQKLSVSRQNAASGDIDLASEKSTIDSYFKGSDWFIENNGHVIIAEQETQGENSSQGDTSGTLSFGRLISFDNLRDEMSADGNSIDVSGTILSENVGSVTLNNSQVSISGDNTFTLTALPLRNSVNDIVVKIYDTEKNIQEKQVYTVYTNARTTGNTSTSSFQGVTTYEVDATEFGFTEPSATGKFSTTSSEITIRGFTSAKDISKVEVNGFKLGSFNGSTWRYHAFKRFETLEEGTNQYRVDYFGTEGNIVYTDYYTIVKKAPGSIVTNPGPSTNISEENIEEVTTEEVTEETIISGEADI